MQPFASESIPFRIKLSSEIAVKAVRPARFRVGVGGRWRCYFQQTTMIRWLLRGIESNDAWWFAVHVGGANDMKDNDV